MKKVLGVAVAVALIAGMVSVAQARTVLRSQYVAPEFSKQLYLREWSFTKGQTYAAVDYSFPVKEMKSRTFKVGKAWQGLLPTNLFYFGDLGNGKYFAVTDLHAFLTFGNVVLLRGYRLWDNKSGYVAMHKDNFLWLFNRLLAADNALLYVLTGTKALMFTDLYFERELFPAAFDYFGLQY